MSFVYLASPYSHPSEEVRESRFAIACSVAAELMLSGYTVFCPIAHSHPISKEMTKGAAIDFAFWMKQDLPILSKAQKLFLLKLPGWENSKGMQKEISFAKENNIPIVEIRI